MVALGGQLRAPVLEILRAEVAPIMPVPSSVTATGPVRHVRRGRGRRRPGPPALARHARASARTTRGSRPRLPAGAASCPQRPASASRPPARCLCLAGSAYRSGSILWRTSASGPRSSAPPLRPPAPAACPPAAPTAGAASLARVACSQVCRVHVASTTASACGRCLRLAAQGSCRCRRVPRSSSCLRRDLCGSCSGELGGHQPLRPLCRCCELLRLQLLPLCLQEMSLQVRIDTTGSSAPCTGGDGSIGGGAGVGMDRHG